jgi:hypothetical protein
MFDEPAAKNMPGYILECVYAEAKLGTKYAPYVKHMSPNNLEGGCLLVTPLVAGLVACRFCGRTREKFLKVQTWA